MVTGAPVITSPVVLPSNFGDMLRRKSPSVTTPSSLFLASTTPTQPKCLAVISISALSIVSFGETSGNSLPTCMMSDTLRS